MMGLGTAPTFSEPNYLQLVWNNIVTILTLVCGQVSINSWNMGRIYVPGIYYKAVAARYACSARKNSVKGTEVHD